MFKTKEQRVSENLAMSGVDSERKISNIKQKKEEPEFYVCQTCGKKYKKRSGNFTPSKSPLYAGTGGYLNTCKSCVDELFKQYTAFYNNNEEKAIERICQIFDLYFNENALVSSKKINEGRSRISSYISKIQINPYTGKTYSDTIIEHQTDSTASADELSKYSGMDSASIKKTISVWGFGFTSEQYSILNDQFDDWKSRVVIDSKTRETLVRELCIIKLQMNIALQTNNVELYTKLMKTYQETMKSANLQPLQQDENDKASEKPIGVMIQMFENERPISEPREEWKDVDHIIKYITIYFLGHLCKMLKIKNRYSALYEKEMAKYRVEVPELEESDDDEVFDFLVNGGAENGTEKD